MRCRTTHIRLPRLDSSVRRYTVAHHKQHNSPVTGFQLRQIWMCSNKGEFGWLRVCLSFRLNRCPVDLSLGWGAFKWLGTMVVFSPPPLLSKIVSNEGPRISRDIFHRPLLTCANTRYLFIFTCESRSLSPPLPQRKLELSSPLFSAYPPRLPCFRRVKHFPSALSSFLLRVEFRYDPDFFREYVEGGQWGGSTLLFFNFSGFAPPAELGPDKKTSINVCKKCEGGV